VDCAESSPHPGCVFFVVTNEPEAARVNGAGEDRDYCQIVPPTFWCLDDLLERVKSIDDVAREELSACYYVRDKPT
jgi:hypothetical protein